MHRVRNLVVLIGILVTLSTSLFATTTVTGTRVQYPSGALLGTGQWCFASQCATVTTGAFTESVTAGTQIVTVTDGSLTTYLTITNVVISGTTFNWDNYIVTSSQVYSGLGSPRMACAQLATYTQTDSTPANKSWSCTSVNGQLMWVAASGTAVTAASGQYGGTAAPSFSCTVPCTYYQYNSTAVSFLVWEAIGMVGQASTTWSAAKTSLAGGGTATYAVGAAAGTSPGTPACKTNHICDSISGTISFTTGTATTTGTLLTVTTGVTRTNYPNVSGKVRLAASPYTEVATMYVDSTATTVVYTTSAALTASTAYELTYSLLGQ